MEKSEYANDVSVRPTILNYLIIYVVILIVKCNQSLIRFKRKQQSLQDIEYKKLRDKYVDVYKPFGRTIRKSGSIQTLAKGIDDLYSVFSMLELNQDNETISQAELTSILEYDRGYLPALIAVASNNYREGKYSKALENCKIAISTNPNAPACVRVLSGMCLYKMGYKSMVQSLITIGNDRFQKSIGIR